MLKALVLVALTLLQGSRAGELFDYYASGGITAGLSYEDGTTLTLNGKPIQMFSGAFHYFRTHPAYWRDRLQKLKACGFNAVETYVPWNLHEPMKGEYDFGQGTNEFSEFLDLDAFLTLAKEEDLFVIIRPGPYICSEWDFGGLPSYLLSDPEMKVRTSYQPYLDRVGLYFQELIPIIARHQWTIGSSEVNPVIAAQIENEYGHLGVIDAPHLRYVRDAMVANGLDQVPFFTSDDVFRGYDGTIYPDVLMTVNFYDDPEVDLAELQSLQPDRPLWVMEYWNGWFDHWLTTFHETRPTQDVIDRLNVILSFNSSVNFYMFLGGTNFGFMAGANSLSGVFPYYAPDTTSYDYDGALTEYGDYTEKYDAICARIIEANGQVNPPLPVPDRPAPTPTANYGRLAPLEAMTMDAFLANNDVPVFATTERPVYMEELSEYRNGGGQDFGFINYRLENLDIRAGEYTLQIQGLVRDIVYILVNGEQVNARIESALDLINPGGWVVNDPKFVLTLPEGPFTLDLLVENLGRINFGTPIDFVQYKGLSGRVTLDGEPLEGWQTYPLRFDRTLMSSGLTGWSEDMSQCSNTVGPCLYRFNLEVDTPADTFLNPYPDGPEASSWKEGIVWVNGFNLGRYWFVGPTKTMYVPGPLLVQGSNEFIFFETGNGGSEIAFDDAHCLLISDC